jgi:hypothetical protein
MSDLMSVLNNWFYDGLPVDEARRRLSLCPDCVQFDYHDTDCENVTNVIYTDCEVCGEMAAPIVGGVSSLRCPQHDHNAEPDTPAA